MESGHALTKILSNHFKARKQKNARYSLRSFAIHLGVSPATLSKILNSKANLSQSTIKKVSSKLHLSDDEKQLLKVSEFDPYVVIDTKHSLAKPLLENWVYFAILSLAETKNFKGKANWIARRLSIGIQVAEKAIADLLELGLLSQSANGTLVAKSVNLTFSGSLVGRNPPIRPQKSHVARLRLAQKNLISITEENFAQSDFSSMTVAINKEKLPEAKKRIFNFRRSLGKFLEASHEKQEVYVLSVQLFPVSSSE